MKPGARRIRGILLKTGWRVGLAVFLMLAAALYMRVYSIGEVVPERAPLEGFPLQVGQWKSSGDYTIKDGALDILKVSDYVFRDFTNQREKLSLYIGYYSTHRGFAEIHTPENCQAGGGWTVRDEKTRALDIPSLSRKIRVNEAVYEKGQERYLFLYWYLVNDRYITGFFSYKLNVILSSLWRHRSDAAFVRVAVPIRDGDVQQALKAGEGFLMELIPVIDGILT